MPQDADAPLQESAIQVDDDLRRALGLEAEEAVRVLDVGVRTILLERAGGPSSTALPWDRDLVVAVDVRALPLADLLGLIHVQKKSGFLFFTHRDHGKSVHLHQGEVVFASSNQRADRLGECLLRAGAIGIDQLREAERRYEGDGRFGKVLVERGFLTPRELWNGVKYQVEEIVRSLFAYTAGIVYLWEGEVQPDNVVRLALPTARLIAEGLQRRDELLKFLAVLEDPRMRLARVPGESAAKLAANERAFFNALETHHCFAELCRIVGLDPLTAARTVQLLRLVGAVRLSRVAAADAALGAVGLHAHDEDAVRECIGAHLKLLGELSTPIIALDGARDFAQRLSRVLDEARERHPELLTGVAVGPHAELDLETLTDRALRLPGQRVAGVSAALGELVSYLEFELRNHPRIPEPDEFLSGLEELRTAISV